MEMLNLAACAALVMVSVYLTIISVYVLFVTVGAWFYRQRDGETATLLKAAVVVPAHNEGAGIRQTIDDLLALDYPRERFDVYVLADNCTDDTAAIASACGAIVKERQDDVNRGKGQALDWFLDRFGVELERYDIVAFVDADMSVDPGFLRAMSMSFNSDSREVVQARYTISPNVASWQEAIAFASFANINHVRPAGRCFWGGTASLNGSGMAFRRALILGLGWPMHSIAEDHEYSKGLILRGIRVIYEPRAVVTGRTPSTFRQIAVQQSRWEGGKQYIVRRYLGPIVAAFLRRPSALLLDSLLDLLVPPLSVVLLLSLVGGLAAVVTGWLSPWWFLAAPCVFALAVLTGLVQLRAPAKIWGSLCLAPIFVVWKLFLLVRIVSRRRETEWKRTPRNADE
jgi:cellulose synthase/poly-beta-1,6-N-acetylglucosamine synthase-like glycosyltransferase